MAIQNPSLNWDKLGSIYYRKCICYGSDENDNEIPLNIPNLKNINVSIGPFASILAVYSNQLSPFTLSNKFQPISCISLMGDEIFSINWNFNLNPLALNGIGWTPEGNLIIVKNNGHWRIYENYLGDFEEYSLADFGIELLDSNETSSDELSLVSSVQFKSNGFAFKLNDNTFIYIQSPFNKSDNIIKFHQFTTSHSIEPFHISQWTLIPPDNGEIINKVRFAVSTSAGLCILSESTLTPTFILPHLTQINLMAVSSNGDFLAVLNGSELIILDITVNLNAESDDSNVEKINNSILITHIVDPHVKSIQWCSNDAVILAYDEHLLLLGPLLETLTIPLTPIKTEENDEYFQNEVYLHSELDGIYYLTNDSLNFLSRVPSVLESAYLIGSTSPSSILLDALKLYESNSPKVYENINHLKNDSSSLTIAVDGCIRAASEESLVYWQKRLLRAASLGKIEIEVYDPKEWVDVTGGLRVINNLKDIGIWLSWTQWQDFGLNNLFKLLIKRNEFYLSLKICEWLDIDKGYILQEWASTKIKSISRGKTNSPTTDDDYIFNEIWKNLKPFSSNSLISWTSLAKISHLEARPHLTRQFLSLEQNTQKSINLLIEINEMGYALSKADEEIDIDSIILVLLNLIKENNLTDVFRYIHGKPHARQVFLNIVSKLTDGRKANINSKLMGIKWRKNWFYQEENYLPLVIEEFKENLIENNKKSLNPEKQIIQTSIPKLKKSNENLLPSLSNSLKNISKVYDMQIKYAETIPDIKIGEPLMHTIIKIVDKDIKLAIDVGKHFNINGDSLASTILNTLISKANKTVLTSTQSGETDSHIASNDQRQHYVANTLADLYDFSQTTLGRSLHARVYFYTLVQNGYKRQAAIYLDQLNGREKVRGLLLVGRDQDAFKESTKIGDEALTAAFEELDIASH
ncbi:tethering complex subunit [Martiniozyma asiatica (nom. inval.)]|nr:tethering complex subunit [Martiniozyma asiatica]